MCLFDRARAPKLFVVEYFDLFFTLSLFLCVVRLRLHVPRVIVSSLFFFVHNAIDELDELPGHRLMIWLLLSGKKKTKRRDGWG